MRTQGRKEVAEAVLIAGLTTLVTGVLNWCMECAQSALERHKEKQMIFKHIPVSSSNVLSVAYHGPTKTLQVHFKDKAGKLSGTYDYTPVEGPTFEGLLKAESVGKYLRANVITNPAVTCRRV